MSNSMNRSLLVLLLLLLGFFVHGQAQTEEELLAELIAKDEEAINALVLYPEDTRLAILEATKYPEALIKLESVQSQTSKAFRAFIEDYPRSTQEMIWDLTRYPGLIELLVETGPEKQRELDLVLKDFPEVIRDRARKAVKGYSPVLVRVNELDRNAAIAFDRLLINYPTSAREALRQLVALPEVLTILTDNIRLAVLVGDLYTNEPEYVLKKVDSLNLVVARQNAEELEEWKKSLEEDPQAVGELEASAETFQEEYGYDDLYYDGSDYDDLYYEDKKKDARVVHEYYHYHYPYWFSYPYWYQYPRWRLYPDWYDWGFYFGPGQSIIVVNLPSFYFTHWYFYHPHHHYRWSYLSAHFTRHYSRHYRVGSPITTGVTGWRDRNRDIVSDHWLRDDARLSERFRAYGKFEADRSRYNRSHPQRELSQEEFRKRNPQRYRTLSSTVAGRQRAIDRTRVQPTERRKPTSQTESRTKTKERVVSPSRIPRVNRGTERHRSISERSKTSRTRTIRPVTPQTKAPKRTTSRARTSPSSKKKTTKRRNN